MRYAFMSIFFSALILTKLSFAGEDLEQTAAKVRYKAGREVDFEQLLIQGQLQRPELSIVTGDTGNSTDGLLRLRENFSDQLTMAAGEEVAAEEKK